MIQSNLIFKIILLLALSVQQNSWALDENYIKQRYLEHVDPQHIKYLTTNETCSYNKIKNKKKIRYQKIIKIIKELTHKEKTKEEDLCLIEKFRKKLKKDLQGQNKKSYYIYQKEENKYPIQIFKSGKIILHLKDDDINSKKGGYKKFYRGINLDSANVEAVLETEIKNIRSLEKIISELKIMETMNNSKHNSSYFDFDIVIQKNKEILTKNLIINTKLQHGDLSYFFHKKNNLSTMLQILITASQAVLELHKKGYIHQDIKPQNFLYSIVNNSLEVYLTDYGLTKHYSDRSFGKYICGTRGQIDPHVCFLRLSENISYHSFKQGTQADVFSLGIAFDKIFFQSKNLLSINKDLNKIAFPEKGAKRGSLEELEEKIEIFKTNHNKLLLDSKKLSEDNKLTEEIRKLVLKMISPDPLKRPSLQKILKQLNKTKQIFEKQV